MVCRDALEPADGNRFFLDTSSPARRLARPVASAPQSAGKNVRVAIEELGIVITAFCDQSQVAGNVCMGRTRPLAIDNLVVVTWIGYVRRSHLSGVLEEVLASFAPRTVVGKQDLPDDARIYPWAF